QAYVDFLLTRELNFRAGMLLAPVGIINERHEPPVYHGVERPFVDTVIIPTTWFDAGAGIHGELRHGFRYRAYAMAPLNSLEFSADEGIREGRQKGRAPTCGTWHIPGAWNTSASADLSWADAALRSGARSRRQARSVDTA